MTAAGHAAPGRRPVRVLVPQEIDPALPPFGAAVHAIGGPTMGTSWEVRWAGDAPRAAELRAAVEAELDTVVAQMSTWRADSDVGRFNRAPAGSVHRLPAAMAEVLDASLALARLSGGAFDPAAGALVNRWGFGPAPRHDAPGFVPPDAAEVAAARARGGWQRLQRPAPDRLAQPGGVELDFSAIAKGHAVDRVAARLRALGVGHALVEVGGELRGEGVRPDGQPWWVALDDPAGGDASALAPTRIALHGLSVATSGDWRRCFVVDGRRLAHTIDPRDGWPVAHGVAAVSVVHRSCMWADGWATALTVLGVEAGTRLARDHGIAARFVRRLADGRLEETLTPALQELAS